MTIRVRGWHHLRCALALSFPDEVTHFGADDLHLLADYILASRHMNHLEEEEGESLTDECS